MQNISILQDLNINICAITTLHKLNYHEMPNIAAFLEMAEIGSWQVQLASPSGRMTQQMNHLINEEDFRKICNHVFTLRQRYLQIKIEAADCFGPAPAGAIRGGEWGGCSAGIASLGIDACGYVMPCLSLQSFKIHENLLNKPIEKIWENSPMFDFNRKFKKENAKGRCEDCKFLDDCRGGCASQSFSYNGCYHSAPFCFARSFCD